MKKNIKMTCLIGACMCALFLVGCSTKKDDQKTTDSVKEAVTTEESIAVIDSAEKQYDTDSEEDKQQETDAITYQNTKTIENDMHGYVEVPEDFIEFLDEDEDDDGILYSDAAEINIISMQIIDGTNLDEGAELLMDYLTEEGEMQDMTGAVTTISGKTAKQIYGYYPDEDLYMVLWVVESNTVSERIHIIGVEFTEDQQDLFYMVEDTYRLPE